MCWYRWTMVRVGSIASSGVQQQAASFETGLPTTMTAKRRPACRTLQSKKCVTDVPTCTSLMFLQCETNMLSSLVIVMALSSPYLMNLAAELRMTIWRASVPDSKIMLCCVTNDESYCRRSLCFDEDHSLTEPWPVPVPTHSPWTFLMLVCKQAYNEVFQLAKAVHFELEFCSYVCFDYCFDNHSYVFSKVRAFTFTTQCYFREDPAAAKRGEVCQTCTQKMEPWNMWPNSLPARSVSAVCVVEDEREPQCQVRVTLLQGQ